MEVIKVSPEALQKALVTLGLSKADFDTTTAVVDEAKEKEIEKAKQQEIQKAADADKIKSDYADVLKKAEEIKKQAQELNIDLDSSKMGNPDGGTITSAASTPVIAKGIESDSIIKGLTEQVKALGTLVLSASEENKELKKGLDAASEFQAELAERLGMVEKQPAGRKSITTVSYIPKEFEKGGDGNKGGERVLSLSNQAQRKQLIDALWDASGANSGNIKDQEFAKASSYLEATRNLAGDNATALRIAARLKSEQKIVVVN